MERRKDQRLRCHLLCRIEYAGETRRGVIRNVSDGGLLLEAEMPEPSQGGSLKLAMRPDGFRPFEVECLAWHIKSRRKAGTTSLGLVLSNAPDAYFAYVASLRNPKRVRVPMSGSVPRRKLAKPTKKPEETKQDQPQKASEEPSPPAMVRHAVQVKQRKSSRVCRLVVAAIDSEAARELTLSEVGPDWDVLAIRAL